MATVTLGNIKLNWKGAYNAGTAYAIDDVVSYNGSSYVAKTATTGNLPTVTANWDIMSQAGTNGTNGTDLTSTLTTQGDIVYRDGSGLARLGYGTAGQVLQTGGSGANPSWGTVSSDLVKLTHVDSTSTVSSHTFQNILNDSLYSGYIAKMQVDLDHGDYLRMRWLNGSTELSGSTDYRRVGTNPYRRADNSENNAGGYNDGNGCDDIAIHNWTHSDASYMMSFTEFKFFGLYQDTNYYKCVHTNSMQRDNSGNDYFANPNAMHLYIQPTNIDGFKISTTQGGNFVRMYFTLWGLKK